MKIQNERNSVLYEKFFLYLRYQWLAIISSRESMSLSAPVFGLYTAEKNGAYFKIGYFYPSNLDRSQIIKMCTAHVKVSRFPYVF